MNSSTATSTLSAVSPWRVALLFAAAGLAAGLVAVLLLSLAIPYLAGFILFYGYGVLFAAFITVAGAIACRLKWISAPASWFRISLAAAITAVAYPLALFGQALLADLVGTWLSHARYFVWLAKVHDSSNGFFFFGALIVSVLLWAALSVVQFQWNMKILLSSTVLGVSWAVVFTVIRWVFESRVENVDWAYWIGLFLSIATMLFGGVCGHALATTSAAHESSVK
jgi:hypothetical protein